MEKSVAMLRSVFTTDPSSPTGLRRNDRSEPNCVAGSVGAKGYLQVTLHGAHLLIHRVVWIIHNGEIPTGMTIDHKDGNRANNAPENLQLLTNAQNCRARNRISRTTKNRFMGVYNHSKGHGWTASFYRGKSIYLGFFDDPVDAARAYNNAVIKWAEDHGETPRYLNPV